MATETDRKWGYVPVKLPNGATVKVRVVTEIAFIDASDRGQEWRYTLYNGLDDPADRDVHVDQVKAKEGNDPNNPDTYDDSTLAVERIDTFRVLDKPDRGQETYPAWDNKTFDENGPPFFTTHQKTHVTKYNSDQQSTGDNGESGWIKTEWIDEVVVVDPKDRYQETHFYITGNPKDDDESKVQDGDPDVSGGVQEGRDGEAVRTCWFQNIVDFAKKDKTPPFTLPDVYVLYGVGGFGLFVSFMHGGGPGIGDTFGNFNGGNATSGNAVSDPGKPGVVVGLALPGGGSVNLNHSGGGTVSFTNNPGNPIDPDTGEPHFGPGIMPGGVPFKFPTAMLVGNTTLIGNFDYSGYAATDPNATPERGYINYFVTVDWSGVSFYYGLIGGEKIPYNISSVTLGPGVVGSDLGWSIGFQAKVLLVPSQRTIQPKKN